jgi:hypothetical protein
MADITTTTIAITTTTARTTPSLEALQPEDSVT